MTCYSVVECCAHDEQRIHVVICYSVVELID